MDAGKGKVAENWLANPAIPYLVVGLAVVGVIMILPWLFKQLFAGVGQAYTSSKTLAVGIGTDVVDTGAATIGQISSIVGAPSTEAPGQQTLLDKFKGLLAGGDSRTWSDLIG